MSGEAQEHGAATEALTPEAEARVAVRRREVAQHEAGLWAYAACAAVGLWLVASPFSLGYARTATGWSEVGGGALAVVLAVMARSARRGWAPWALAGVGVWLLLAPLLFWARDAAAYLNSTLGGALLIGLSVAAERRFWAQPVQPALPPGWTFNPSSWAQRTPIVALAWVCFLISRYMASYQLGYSMQVWDPVFGEGTRRVLESEVARAWPVSDAGLGAAAYALEALSGCMGGASRWRTAPWVVALFGVLVVPAGVVSIVLIILQPVAVGAWCGPCLVTAVAMLIMACLALPEVVAMGQYLAQQRRAGRSLRDTFWRGGPAEAEHERRPVSLSDPAGRVLRAMVAGATVSWNLAACLLLGLWVMLSPVVFVMGAGAEASHFVAGALVITVAGLAVAEPARVLRLGNMVLGGWVISAPWIFAGVGSAARWNAVATGAALVVASVFRGRIEQRYGAWGRWIV